GGANYNAPGGQINMATSPTRQVGSAFKVFTYSAALEQQRVNMDSPILDAPLVFPIGGAGNGPYAPTNYDGRWHGVVSVKEALATSTLADLGVRHRPSPILKITSATGKTSFAYDPAQNATQALSPDVAYIMASILSDDQNRCMEFGCNSDLTLGGRQVAAKTGTSEGFRDNWTLGFTPTLATVSWVGNPDNTPLSHN